MTSKREQALQGLFLMLQNLSGTVVLRNEPLPTQVTAGGLVVLRDGDVGEPEMLLSPMRYIYQHQAELEVLVQDGKQVSRDAKLDALLQAIGALLEQHRTLSGAVDYAHAAAPELLHEAVEGAPTLKAASVPIILEYATTNPLQ
jgi:hypothetical protein